MWWRAGVTSACDADVLSSAQEFHEVSEERHATSRMFCSFPGPLQRFTTLNSGRFPDLVHVGVGDMNVVGGVGRDWAGAISSAPLNWSPVAICVLSKARGRCRGY